MWEPFETRNAAHRDAPSPGRRWTLHARGSTVAPTGSTDPKLGIGWRVPGAATSAPAAAGTTFKWDLLAGARHPAFLVLAASPASVDRARLLAAEIPNSAVGDTVSEAARRVDRACVDVALVAADDLGAQVATVQGLVRLPARLPILVESDAEEPGALLGLLRAGADGVIPPGSSPGVLLRCARAVMAGELVLPRRSVRGLATEVRLATLRDDRSSELLGRLTNREREVVVLQYGGMSTREVAAQMVISETTVRSHVHSGLARLHLRSRDDLFRLLDGM
jgi:DNA-binding NarL/FixJ family response regulator